MLFRSGRDLLAGLTELGFDEISIRKGQKYLTVVVDHHTGRLVWAHAASLLGFRLLTVRDLGKQPAVCASEA